MLCKNLKYKESSYPQKHQCLNSFQAHGLYNSAAARDNSAAAKDKGTKWDALIFNVQKAFWKTEALITFEYHLYITQQLARDLENVRQRARETLSEHGGTILQG